MASTLVLASPSGPDAGPARVTDQVDTSGPSRAKPSLPLSLPTDRTSQPTPPASPTSTTCLDHCPGPCRCGGLNTDVEADPDHTQDDTTISQPRRSHRRSSRLHAGTNPCYADATNIGADNSMEAHLGRMEAELEASLPQLDQLRERRDALMARNGELRELIALLEHQQQAPPAGAVGKTPRPEGGAQSLGLSRPDRLLLLSPRAPAPTPACPTPPSTPVEAPALLLATTAAGSEGQGVGCSKGAAAGSPVRTVPQMGPPSKGNTPSRKRPAALQLPAGPLANAAAAGAAADRPVAGVGIRRPRTSCYRPRPVNIEAAWVESEEEPRHSTAVDAAAVRGPLGRQQVHNCPPVQRNLDPASQPTPVQAASVPDSSLQLPGLEGHPQSSHMQQQQGCVLKMKAPLVLGLRITLPDSPVILDRQQWPSPSSAPSPPAAPAAAAPTGKSERGSQGPRWYLSRGLPPPLFSNPAFCAMAATGPEGGSEGQRGRSSNSVASLSGSSAALPPPTPAANGGCFSNSHLPSSSQGQQHLVSGPAQRSSLCGPRSGGAAGHVLAGSCISPGRLAPGRFSLGPAWPRAQHSAWEPRVAPAPGAGAGSPVTAVTGVGTPVRA